MKVRETKANNPKDFTDELASMLPPERVKRAKREAEKEILQICSDNIGMGVEINVYPKNKKGITQEEVVLLKTD